MTLLWIPYYLKLDERPRVQLLARKHLKLKPAFACGLLMKAYGWLGEHITAKDKRGGLDAYLELEDAEFVLDGIVDHDGFSKAMAKVKWWTFDGKGVLVRNFFEKNGPLALQRAAEQSKKHNQRARADAAQLSLSRESRDDAGTTPGQDQDGDGTGGEDGRDVGGGLPGPTTTKTKTSTKTNNKHAPNDAAPPEPPPDWESAVRSLVDVGVVEGVARKAAGRFAPELIAVACKLAAAAAATGATNPGGIAIERLKDGTAAAELAQVKTQSGSILVREWSRRFLAEKPQIKTQLGLAVVKLARYQTWSAEDVCKALPDEALAMLGEVVRGIVGRGELSAKGIPLALLTPSGAAPGHAPIDAQLGSNSGAPADAPTEAQEGLILHEGLTWGLALLRREKAIAKKVFAAVLVRPEAAALDGPSACEEIPHIVMLALGSQLEKLVKSNEFAAGDIPAHFTEMVKRMREANP